MSMKTKRNHKMNNKGFTLIELLASLVIIIAITSIAMTTISASLERSKNRKEEAQNKLYASAAKLYISDHRASIKKDQCCIGIQYLINEKYLDNNNDIKGCINYRYEDKETEENSEEETESETEYTQKGKRIFEINSSEQGESCLE